MPGSLTAARLKNEPKGAKNLRPLSKREQTLDEMLDHYQEAQEPCYSGGSDGDGTGVIGMPKVWNDSYRKLEKILDFAHHLVLFDQASPDFRSHYISLQAWYLRCIRIPKVSEQKTVRRGQEIVELPRTVRMHVVRNAEPALVLLGLEWVEGHFPGEPFLPKEILEPMAA